MKKDSINNKTNTNLFKLKLEKNKIINIFKSELKPEGMFDNLSKDCITITRHQTINDDMHGLYNRNNNLNSNLTITDSHGISTDDEGGVFMGRNTYYNQKNKELLLESTNMNQHNPIRLKLKDIPNNLRTNFISPSNPQFKYSTNFRSIITHKTRINTKKDFQTITNTDDHNLVYASSQTNDSNNYNINKTSSNYNTSDILLYTPIKKKTVLKETTSSYLNIQTTYKDQVGETLKKDLFKNEKLKNQFHPKEAKVAFKTIEENCSGINKLNFFSIDRNKNDVIVTNNKRNQLLMKKNDQTRVIDMKLPYNYFLKSKPEKINKRSKYTNNSLPVLIKGHTKNTNSNYKYENKTEKRYLICIN